MPSRINSNEILGSTKSKRSSKIEDVVEEVESELVEQHTIYKGSMDDLEKEFNSFIGEMDRANSKVGITIDMAELDEISAQVIEARMYLSSFVKGEKQSVREKAYGSLIALPFIGEWAKGKVHETKVQQLQDSTVKEVLEGIFTSFDIKKKRLVELTGMVDNMRTNLIHQEQKLGEYIEKLEDVLSNPQSAQDKMRAMEMSVMAQSQDKITKEMIYNNLNIIIELMGGLHQKITKTLPVLKNTLTNSLSIVGTINSIKDAIDMMNNLESLSNDIIQQSTGNVQQLIIESTNSLSEGTDIEFYRLSAKRNEVFNNQLLESRKKHITKTFEDYNTLKTIGIDSSHQLENRMKQEAIALGMNLDVMKAANTSKLSKEA